MTFFYDKVYVNYSSVVGGPLEKEGVLKDKFDISYDDYRCGEKTFEKAEVKMMKDCIRNILKKCNNEYKKIDLLVSSDLTNQLSISSYSAREFNIPFLGIYNACASSIEGIILLSSLIDSKKVNNGIVCVSSHNLVSEKQFRNPVEYGGNIKPYYSTFTSTGSACISLSRIKSKIKINSSTIGKVIDSGSKDPFNMGEAMSLACADTLYEHLKNTNTSIYDYDLILSGDLGLYGKKIMIDYMKENYKIDIKNKYNDCGCLIYDLDKQKEVNSGASGPLTIAMYSYLNVLPLLENGVYKKVLLLGTGALFSPTFLYQKESIPSICHAVCLESVL